MAKKINFLVILGPTATGKSDIAVELAHWIADNKIGGYSGAEIVSADSRQVYCGLDIGTGKITKDEMHGIPHHCLDIVDPCVRFTVIDWKRCAEKAIDEISGRGKLPIICGGTGFYISTLIDDLNYPDIEIDEGEQKELEAKTTKELFEELLRIDPRRAKEMVRGNGDNSDGKVSGGGESTNKRRIIRAILIARELGAVPRLRDANKSISKYSPIIIGVTVSDEELKDRIKKRLIKRLDIGMIEEAEKLHADNVINRDTATTNTGLSFERMDELGLEYRYLAKYLQGELNREQFIETLNTKIWQFARRQKTWFKRDKRIMWFMPTEVEEIKKEVNQSLG